ncbi:MAG: RNase adapter RapZ [Bacteroidales bacterium]|nr:phosphotransferase [Bacteroidales bacterium]
MNLKIRNLFNKTFSCELEKITPILAHGSSREYFRCYGDNITCLAAYNEDKKENIAFLDYAGQLLKKGISVPKIYAEDIDNSIYLLEDLGNTNLFDMIEMEARGEIDFSEVKNFYYKVIRELPKIQIEGGRNFDYSNAFPRKAFDSQSIAWDLNYFKYYFLKLSEIQYYEQDLENDFTVLTNFLLSTDCSYFLYRDFQSRNIMLVEDKPFFIDFQGGRKGALQYDLASLLFDAKADLSPEFRIELLDLYISELKQYIAVDEKEFKEVFYAYVYIRIMQAMGAYGFRGYFERKEHFLKSIPFAIANLRWLKDNITLSIKLPELDRVFQNIISSKKLMDISSKKLLVTIKSFSYKKGYPHDISGNGGGFVFDCRAIHNPGRYEEYKALTGKDKEVIAFLEKEEDALLFFENVLKLTTQSVDKYVERKFSNLMICFGCTGGQHRSVFFAEKLSKILLQNPDIDVVLQHIEQNK